jgi:hypothetical protein
MEARNWRPFRLRAPLPELPLSAVWAVEDQIVVGVEISLPPVLVGG